MYREEEIGWARKKGMKRELIGRDYEIDRESKKRDRKEVREMYEGGDR